MQTKSKLIRTFLAFDIDETLKKPLIKIINHFQTKNFPVKWCNPENLHVTLRFYGEISPEKITDLIAALNYEMTDVKEFDLPTEEIKLFPSKSKPIAVALSFPLSKELNQLVTIIEAASQKVDVISDIRPFLPHLTLGRLRYRKNNIDFQHPILIPKSTTVNEIILYRSDITNDGSIYTPLNKWRLK